MPWVVFHVPVGAAPALAGGTGPGTALAQAPFGRAVDGIGWSISGSLVVPALPATPPSKYALSSFTSPRSGYPRRDSSCVGAMRSSEPSEETSDRTHRTWLAMTGLAVFVAVVLFFALLVSYPWIVLTIGTVLYLASLPWGWLSYRRHERKDAATASAAPASPEARPRPQGEEAPSLSPGHPDQPPHRPTRLN